MGGPPRVGASGRERPGRGRPVRRVALMACQEVAQAVATVEIRPELDGTRGLRPGGDVSEIDGHWPRQIEVERSAGFKNFAHAARLLPTRLVACHPLGQREHVLYPHAAGAEGASTLIEERLHRRVMHV